MSVWVISDVHANVLALDRALSIVDEDPAPIIILGDLLTYGPDPVAVIERLAARTDVARWVLGNHDELYLGLLGGAPPPAYGRLPDWLRGSIDWTLEQLGPAATWLREVPFAREVVQGGILFAHANPFGDWRYVDRDEEYREAARVLARRGLSVGVFGHTHRGRFFTDPPRSSALGLHQLAWRPTGAGVEVRVINAGSVGQPRNRTGTATMLRIEGTGRAGSATLHVVEYDTAEHLRRIERLPLPRSTRERLRSFFERFASSC